MVLPSFKSAGGADRNSYGRSRKKRKLFGIPFLVRFGLACISCVFFLNLSVSFYWDHYTLSPPLNHNPHPLLSPEAYPVYGIRSDLVGENKKDVSAVYAVPKATPKGIVLLLHACTHNALKFFAPSSTCPDCIGLAEEMRLARIVLERGYVALAVTARSKGGCWGGEQDVKAIKAALEQFPKDLLQYSPTTVVYAIGASSGGFMAAKLVAEGVAESAAVMVMGLRNQLLDNILSMKGTSKKLYLAPMTRDKRTAKSVRENQAHWNQKQKQHFHHEMIVDEVSCVPLPVTADYLWNRVPGMTYEAAEKIVSVLLEHEHLDPNTRKLIVDPTQSNWRDFFLARENEIPVPKSLAQTKDDRFLPKSDTNMLLWGTFDLTPGVSPLAKALHRAWAMHEYCSEIVEMALDFFEGQKSRDEILAILQE